MPKPNQRHEIVNIARYIGQARKHEWLLKTPYRWLRKLFLRNHCLCSRKDYYRTVLNELGHSPRHDLDHYIRERKEDGLLLACYERAVRSGKLEVPDETYEDAPNSHKGAEGREANFYAFIRELQPEVVLETGTAAGMHTSWILSAMHKNDKGMLISIDIPPVEGKLTMSTTIADEHVGFLIPEEYRSRWTYVKGDAKIHLPRLMSEHNIDIFIHDSLHTRTHMLFEYTVAHALMEPGGLIVSDDILWNKAFFDFVSSNNLRSFSCISNPNIGLAVNDFDAYEKSVGTGIVKQKD